MIDNQQQTIKEWFDYTYLTRGEMYLRPKNAYYIFAELLQIKPNAKLLDVACGLGRMLEIGLDYKAQCSGVDISSVAVETAKLKLPEANIVEANAEELPFKDNTFDFVTCLGSLERMIDKEKVLQDIKRVTTSDSRICFMVRNSNSWRWLITKKLFLTVNKKGHQDAKNYQQWKALFEKENFEIVSCIPDQWPIMRILQILTFGTFKGYKNKQNSFTPLQYANEFIFILKKN
ncbi:class I SAM-dependent methyltransferase [Flavobacterium procerum]|uniref:Class I SAM-dependent methyltransferase n=1 Tax=Flavobacterium procerum TaxID=1455569 RepID=A0ABV6BM09_9FLAO